jgi:hypothetical protein
VGNRDRRTQQVNAMPGNPEGLRSITKYSKLPTDRIKYLPEASEADLRAIRRGILFLMAFWSGPAVMTFSTLTQVLARLPAQELEVVVADVDGSPELYELPEFRGKVHGTGETAWVREGQIVATSGLGVNVDCFEPNTRALLALP